MAIQGGGVELSQAVDFIDTRVDAIGDWNVNESVVGSKGDCWFGSLLGEGVKTAACSSA